MQHHIDRHSCLDGEGLHCSQTATRSERRQASQCLQLVCRPRYAYCNAEGARATFEHCNSKLIPEQCNCLKLVPRR